MPPGPGLGSPKPDPNPGTNRARLLLHSLGWRGGGCRSKARCRPGCGQARCPLSLVSVPATKRGTSPGRSLCFRGLIRCSRLPATRPRNTPLTCARAGVNQRHTHAPLPLVSRRKNPHNWGAPLRAAKAKAALSGKVNAKLQGSRAGAPPPALPREDKRRCHGAIPEPEG